jgi:hypothetical protein
MQVGLVVMDENPAEALKIVKAADRAGVHSLWTIRPVQLRRPVRPGRDGALRPHRAA